MSTTTDGRSTRWDEHRATRRRELVEATLRAIREHGAGVGMDDIAAAAGTSKTVFYRHFTDRAGLYAAVSESVDARILRDLGAAMGEGGVDGSPDLASAGAAPRAVIAAAIDSYLALVERDPEVYRFVVNAPLLDTHSGGDPALAVTSHIADQMSALLRAALASAGRDPSAATVWGAGVVGMVRAAADHWLADPGLSRSELTTHLTDLAWGGLSAAWPDPSPSA
ncbi:TetR/AcrR family transcriptional regulator [Pedococcus sp. KACC 23699]|uniref:TetR/AcrR family transcriptional regulator n=1 Tax=Pedococcus sp. KACC 23699 TaxID=3149228 RepID=A0AAU7JSP0_9MICO